MYDSRKKIKYKIVVTVHHMNSLLARTIHGRIISKWLSEKCVDWMETE
jgi:hypothetical protein